MPNLFVDGVRWDGKYIPIADRLTNIITRLGVTTPGGLSSVGHTNLSAAGDAVYFDFILDPPAHSHLHRALIGADPDKEGTGFWNYPSGGAVSLKR